ncbi:MAG: hypothetical protein SGCHY_002042 [Lobulomycetales sp.]
MKKSKLKCQMHEWLPKFRHVTADSVVIPIPQDFVSGYLLKDGIQLPPSLDDNAQNAYDNKDQGDYSDDDDYDDDDKSSPDTSGYPDESSPEAVSFPDFEKEIATAIAELGGAVFPKLNWSAPRDAAWIAFGGTLKCTDVASVFILLKASDFVLHDLLHPFDDDKLGDEDSEHDDDSDSSSSPSDGISYMLVLRKWTDLNPSCEFRCFVRNGSLLACCQRDIFNYYSFLHSTKDRIRDSITCFFHSHISGKFPDDTCISGREVSLIDFNPWVPSTDSLLFSWQELRDMQLVLGDNDVPVELRLVKDQSAADMNSMNQPAFTTNRVPKESIDIGTGDLGVEAVEEMVKMMKLQEYVERREKER